MEFTFVKLAGRWYAHLPNFEVSVEELEMVDNAKDFLEGLDSKKKGIITVQINIIPIEHNCKLTLIASDDVGATYEIEAENVSIETIWLCNVVKYVFGEFPENFYIKLS